MNTSRIFTSNPRSVGESYAEHFRSASSFGLTMLGAGLACLLHGVFPFLFERTGSDAIRRLYDRMVVNRSRLACAAHPTASATSATEVCR
ncbi:MAG: DUF6356 family protein [Proteobacteria bacterium]|nr:DUF6356 family protein [Pseudomonadota bacterium]